MCVPLFCIYLKSEMLCICRFSPSSVSPRLLWNIGGFGAKRYFTDYGIAKPMDSFRDSFSVRKMHDSTRRTNFKQYSIPAK